MKHWFLQVLGIVGFEVTVLGRVGHDVILAAPLPRLELPQLPPPPASVLELDEVLARRLVQLDGVLLYALTGRRWKEPDRRWRS